MLLRYRCFSLVLCVYSQRNHSLFGRYRCFSLVCCVYSQRNHSLFGRYRCFSLVCCVYSQRNHSLFGRYRCFSLVCCVYSQRNHSLFGRYRCFSLVCCVYSQRNHSLFGRYRCFSLVCCVYSQRNHSLFGRYRCFSLVCCVYSQRNHSLFGSIVSAVTGYTRPFLNHTQSLHGTSPQTQKVAPANNWNTIQTKLLKENSLNGKIGTAASCNHLNIDSHVVMNHTPSPRPSLNIPLDSETHRPSNVRLVEPHPLTPSISQHTVRLRNSQTK